MRHLPIHHEKVVRSCLGLLDDIAKTAFAMGERVARDIGADAVCEPGTA